MATGGRKNDQAYEFDYFFNKTSSGGSDENASEDSAEE